VDFFFPLPFSFFPSRRTKRVDFLPFFSSSFLSSGDEERTSISSFFFPLLFFPPSFSSPRSRNQGDVFPSLFFSFSLHPSLFPPSPSKWSIFFFFSPPFSPFLLLLPRMYLHYRGEREDLKPPRALSSLFSCPYLLLGEREEGRGEGSSAVPPSPCLIITVSH